VLVVAATPAELEFVGGADTFVCGFGPVEAAVSTARALATRRYDTVLHIGIAGARRLSPGTIVIGTEAVYCDLVDPGSSFPRIDRVTADPALLTAAARALPEAQVVPIATTARVGGGRGCCEVEGMEGFGVLRAAEMAGVPALELRAISNRLDDPRAEWRIDDAIAALALAVPRVLEALDA